MTRFGALASEARRPRRGGTCGAIKTRMSHNPLAQELLVAQIELRRAQQALSYGGAPARERFRRALDEVRQLKSTIAALQIKPRPNRAA